MFDSVKDPRGLNSAPTEREGSTIRIVSARTGLPMETLRVWERRYGFPRPERRPGSNRRLYSSADIERLIAIQRALACGYRVGDVIGKTIPELERLPDLSIERPERPPTSSGPPPASTNLIELLACDQVSALEAEIRRAAVSLGPRRFVVELAYPFAVSVGQAWAEGKLSVRHEHLATECLITQLRQMLASYQDIAARPLVLLATLPGEPHTLALQMVALYLVVLGAKPRLIGGPTPPDEIVESARVFDADVVGLTVTPTSDLRQARRDVKTVRRKLPDEVLIWLGGAAAASLALEDESTRIVTSWDAIERTVSEWRARPPRASRLR